MSFFNRARGPNDEPLARAKPLVEAVMSYLRANPNALAECTAPLGDATILNLDWVDRVDSPAGRAAMPPGRPAAHFLQATPLYEVPLTAHRTVDFLAWHRPYIRSHIAYMRCH